MYLSDTDLSAAIESGRLIVGPKPSAIDATSIDLHLDAVDEAKVWDVDRLTKDNRDRGLPDLQLNIARMNYGKISLDYLRSPPREGDAPSDARVVRRDDCVVLRPGGFLLWQTREIVGTPKEAPEFICFVDGKSTRARTGLVVHLTAPTIHAGWSGNITLEMTNCGPLHLVLHEGDAVAQIVVAKITSPPTYGFRTSPSATLGQTHVTGSPKGQGM